MTPCEHPDHRRDQRGDGVPFCMDCGEELPREAECRGCGEVALVNERDLCEGCEDDTDYHESSLGPEDEPDPVPEGD